MVNCLCVGMSELLLLETQLRGSASLLHFSLHVSFQGSSKRTTCGSCWPRWETGSRMKRWMSCTERPPSTKRAISTTSNSRASWNMEQKTRTTEQTPGYLQRAPLNFFFFLLTNFISQDLVFFSFSSCWDLLHTFLALRLPHLWILRLLRHTCTFIIRLEGGREREDSLQW